MPDGPADPLVNKVALRTVCSSIASKRHFGMQSMGPFNNASLEIPAGSGCFSFSSFITLSDGLRTPFPRSSSWNLRAA